MGVSALVVMLLLAFFLVIAASLTIWAALGLKQHTPLPARPPADESQAPAMIARPSNDEVRGARVKVTQRGAAREDAFERFLRSDKPRDDADF